MLQSMADDELPFGWDDAFGDLDARTLSTEERLNFVNRHVESALREKGWAVRGGGEEAELVWRDALRCFVDGLWVACIFCCHAVCERELAGIIAISPARINERVGGRWESFGLGRLLVEAEREGLLPPQTIADLRALSEARKPYGHWRSVTHDELLSNRIARESDATGHTDYLNLKRPRFDADSFRVWKENVDHAEEDSGGDEAASDPARARPPR